MFASSVTRRLATGVAFLALVVGTTGCRRTVGSALPMGPGLASLGPTTSQGVIRGSSPPPSQGGVASVYQRGPALGWERATRINSGFSALPIPSMGPTRSLSCGAVPFGVARAVASPGGLGAGPLRGMAPIQKAQAMTAAIQSPYYRPAGFKPVGDELVVASAAATDPRCGHSVFVFLQFGVIPWGGAGSPGYQFR